MAIPGRGCIHPCLTVVAALLAGVFVAATACADEPQKKLTDEEITKLLVGKWYSERTVGGTEIKATDTYRKDGTSSGEAVFTRQGRAAKVSITATWKVVDGTLVETIESTDPPVPTKGRVSKDRIVSVTDKELRIETPDGKEVVKKRVEE